MRWIVNRRQMEREVDVRTSLLDLLREHLHLFGAKKGAIRGPAAPALSWSTASASIPASL
jgi:aerobic-type carbon monoxide dehydrogenase small subunit (CoxS/CutS family)